MDAATAVHTYFVENVYRANSRLAIGVFIALYNARRTAGAYFADEQMQAREKSAKGSADGRAAESRFCIFRRMSFFSHGERFITTLLQTNTRRAFRFFLVNLTLLPFDIWVIDSVVRAYKEFGRFLIVLRVFVLIGLIAALWFGVRHFDLTGIIAIVVVASLIERFVSTTVLLRKLDVKWQDWRCSKRQ